jgi:quercetin dioxygenase-like cupin family protein
MTTQTYQPPKATGAYEITMFADTKIEAVSGLKLGIVHFPKGKRSPPEGRRISARIEMAYVISGQLQVETDSGAFILSAGDSLLGNLSEAHSTLALADSSVFFVGLDP